MKKISFLILFAMFVAATVFGQDAATQSQIDKLSGQIQDLLAAQERQNKQIDALAKEISELRDKVNTPQVNNSASNDDLKNLAEKVQEIDKKRQADRDLILKEIEKLGKVAAGAPPHPKAAPNPPPSGGGDSGGNAPATPQKGYEYTVKSGDTLAAIAKAYREQGVKVTTSQILKANPGLDANKLYAGKKIFIPDPNAK
jgi:LysM repeat protein